MSAALITPCAAGLAVELRDALSKVADLGAELAAEKIRAGKLEAQLSSPAPAAVLPDMNQLAEIIRKVDGNHSLGAGVLAEAILEELGRNPVAPVVALPERAELDRIWREIQDSAIRSTEAPHVRFAEALARLNPAAAQVQDVDALVSRFLAWPLPDSVCVDGCAKIPAYPHRHGTNLLTADEAKAMLSHVLAPPAAPAQDVQVRTFAEVLDEAKSLTLLGEKSRRIDTLAEALKSARLFIRNGIDLGFIRMPDADTPDPAHDTLPMIDAALAAYKGDATNPPANCRQRLAAEGKPYPRSSCQACGQFSPNWRECDAALAGGAQ